MALPMEIEQRLPSFQVLRSRACCPGQSFRRQSRPHVADEAVSSLDVSVQAQAQVQALNLLEEHQRESGNSYVFITHDLGVARYLSDDILALYAGHVAEYGLAEAVLGCLSRPYTEALLSGAPIPDPEATQNQIRLEGSVPTVRSALRGCFFAGRCPRKIGDICDTSQPPEQAGPNSDGHIINCHIPVNEPMELQKQTQNGVAV